jgi:PQQ-dependent catabolism-associated CXXCW motif protein
MQPSSVIAALAGALIVAASAVLSVVLAGEAVPEPADYRTNEYRAPVPATLKGARVIDTEEAETLLEKGEAIFIDVYPQAPKPPNLPKSTVWRTPKHETISDAVWLPNVGYGLLNPDFEKYFRDGLARLTGGDKTKPLVLFCLRDCWMSWNAAKRALEWGHENVLWYPDGTDGWKEWSLPTEMATPAQ